MVEVDGVRAPFADDVRAVAAHLGVVEEQVVPAPIQGQVNVTVFLGEELVLRLPRTPRASELLTKEAQVLAVVQDAGLPTAQLVSHDETLRVASVPYVVLQRVRGQTLAERVGGPGRRRALGSLGEVLVALHQLRRSEVGARLPAVPAPYAFSAPELLDELVEAGEIGGAQHDWLLERFALLEPQRPLQPEPVLVHRDVIPSNVLVDGGGRVTALLDWGCAEWGPAARDLVGLPLRDLPDLLFGYRAASGASQRVDDLALESDALRLHLFLALARLLKRPSTSQDRDWAAPRSATLLDLLAFAAGASAETWPARLRRASAGEQPGRTPVDSAGALRGSPR